MDDPIDALDENGNFDLRFVLDPWSPEKTIIAQNLRKDCGPSFMIAGVFFFLLLVWSFLFFFHIPKFAEPQKNFAIPKKKRKRTKRKPKTAAEKQEESFQHYQYLPAELRMMVIDEMEPVDRIRFSQCSVLSSMEAKRSKNYMDALEFHCYNDYRVKITVTYDVGWDNGFVLKFMMENNKKYMKYINFKHKEFWRTELPISTDLVQFAAEYFKNMLRDYQHIIKKLNLYNRVENKLNNFDFGIRHLNNLEWIDMHFNSSILQITSKLRKPLKVLVVYGEQNCRELQNYEISNISTKIDLPNFKLNYEQFIQLSAPNIFVNIGELTERNIFKIIKTWQNQATGGKKIKYQWDLKDSIFNIPKLLRLLGAENTNDRQEVLMEIKHGFEEGKTTRLSRSGTVLKLEAWWNGRYQWFV